MNDEKVAELEKRVEILEHIVQMFLGLFEQQKDYNEMLMAFVVEQYEKEKKDFITIVV